jgi:hypothetical protein
MSSWSFQPSRALLMWMGGTMTVESVAMGIASPALESAFGEAQRVARFGALPDNLPLLLPLTPFKWLLGAFGRECFFRGFS